MTSLAARVLLRTLLPLLSGAVWAALAADSPVYFMVGGSLELTPARAPAKITGVSWKWNGDVVAECIEPDVSPGFWGGLPGRASLDKATGVLHIWNMTRDLQGVFTVEINDQLQPGGYKAEALRAVPRPKVELRTLTCSADSENCTLGCLGDTEGAGPVRFSWKRGEERWQEGEENLQVTNQKEEEARPRDYTCRMTNPVSVQDSEAFPDPFSSRGGGGGGLNVTAIVVAVVLLLVALVVVGVVVLYRFRNKEPVSRCLERIRGLLRGERAVANSNGGVPHPGAATLGDPAAVEMLGGTPEGETPEGETPEGEAPEGEAPESKTPEGEAPEGEAPEGETPESKTPEDEAPEGEAPEGETPESKTPEDEAPEGDPSEGALLGSPSEVDPLGTGGTPPSWNSPEPLLLVTSSSAHAQ